MAQVVLNPTADCTIRDDSPTTNVDGQNLYTGERQSATNIFRSLLKFDLSSIPAGSTITKVLLSLYDKGTADWATSAGVIHAYRCLQAWVENQVTWNAYSTGNNWATAGAGNTTTDRESTSLGNVSVPATEVPIYYEMTITPSAVQEWLDGTLANNGFLLKTASESNDMHEIFDRLQAYPPKLTVIYTPPSTSQALLIASSSNRIENSNPTVNYSSQAVIQVGEWNGGSAVDRGYVKFDLSSIPSTATITSAILKMYDNGNNYSNNTRTMSVYRILRATVASQQTWNIYSTGNNWGTAGAANTTTDREASAIGTVSAPATEVQGYMDITLTASAIQEMITGGSFTNNGFLLQMATETDDMHEFHDETVTNKEPLLIVDYTLPPDFPGAIEII